MRVVCLHKPVQLQQGVVAQLPVTDNHLLPGLIGPASSHAVRVPQPIVCNLQSGRLGWGWRLGGGCGRWTWGDGWWLWVRMVGGCTAAPRRMHSVKMWNTALKEVACDFHHVVKHSRALSHERHQVATSSQKVVSPGSEPALPAPLSLPCIPLPALPCTPFRVRLSLPCVPCPACPARSAPTKAHH